MSQEENLLALGAVCVAGDLIWKNKSMGQTRNGVFTISQDGLDALSVEDVVPKEVRVTKTRSKATSAANELDALLGDE